MILRNSFPLVKFYECSKSIITYNGRIQHHNIKKSVSSVYEYHQQRNNSSSDNSHALQYLETWVGAKPSNQKTTSNSTSSPTISPSPMQVTGSSYILPTIRLPKTISSSKELNAQLESFLDDSNRNTPHAIRSMLKPKSVIPSPSSPSIIGDKQKIMTWRVPIILDLKAFQHDGSPHYKPPLDGFVKSIVNVLDEWGITVIGVCNIQQDENRDVSIVEQVVNLGLPVLMSKVGRTLGGTLNKNGSSNVNHVNGGNSDDVTSKSFGIEELVQVVTKQYMDNMSLFPEEDEIKAVKETPGKETAVIKETNDKSPSRFQDDLDDDESISSLHPEEIEEMSFRQLQKECKSRKLGAVGSSDVLRQRLLDHSIVATYGLEEGSEKKDVPLSSIDKSEKDETDDKNDSVPTIVPPVAAKVYKGNVRSGQQVASDEPNQSLIVIGNVSSGGEVMSDGDLYVYGALRGRALAGLSKNNNDSKIFASRFDAELVCIGDHFTTIDSITELGLKSTNGAMVSIDEDKASLEFTKF